MKARKAVIIGAGPAGLTAAYELLHRTDVVPVIYEMTGDIGGISKTVTYKGNRMDMGPHRFFSKSDRVINFWLTILPREGDSRADGTIVSRDSTDRLMLQIERLTRILFLGKFFDYPISLNWNTLRNLGVARLIRIGLSYCAVRVFPRKDENSLEDFFINRFGAELYATFFRDYTQKVWGISCREIPASWGAQRVKGLSIGKAISHALARIIKKDRSLSQKPTETSLIESFLYPKLGVGQMYSEIARIVQERGGTINLCHRAVGFNTAGNRITAAVFQDQRTGQNIFAEGDYYFSTMPIRELVTALGSTVPEEVQKVAQGLVYRDYLIVGILAKKLKFRPPGDPVGNRAGIADNWIYVQEQHVKMGRLDFFNNFGGFMSPHKEMVWMGAEYFCTEGDELWSKSDEEMARFAVEELALMDFVDREDVMDHTVVRMKKAYPAYFGTYDKFELVQNFANSFENLFLIGRNGMHKYNNMDHSILTAMIAVDSIVNGIRDRSGIWSVNTEEEYQETKKA